jgi:hypothetical protein
MSERLMDGFPPRPETQVTLANWRTAPFNRCFHHVREWLPTADTREMRGHFRAAWGLPGVADHGSNRERYRG